MKLTLSRFTSVGLITAALLCVPGSLLAQSTNKPPTQKAAPAKPADADKPAKSGPFHGKLAALDKVAKTITVGKRSFQITSETKLKKAGKPATLDDAVLGETVSGYVKALDGKLVASSVNFGPKEPTSSEEKPKHAATKDQP